MMARTWSVDTNQSDVLIRDRHSIIAYLTGKTNDFKGTITLENNELKDVNIDFTININTKERTKTNIGNQLNDFLVTNKHSTIHFESISFQKINSNINFLKGNLTLNNITKTVELDAILIDLETKICNSKAIFEMIGKINRQDFDLNKTTLKDNRGIAIGNEINLIVNLEFSVLTN